jgi:N-acetyltransferase
VYILAMTVIPDGRTLGNDHVRLDPLHLDDSDELFSAFDDERVWAGGWGGGPAARPHRPEDMRTVVEKLTAADACYAVRHADTGEIVGSASLLDVDLVNEHCMLGGAAYAPSVWGTPVNAATNLALLEHAFQDCGFGRVTLQTDVLNTRMQAAIEKMGAHREGVLRRHKRRADGTFRDSVVFSILAEEWPATRQRLSSRVEGPGPERAPADSP